MEDVDISRQIKTRVFFTDSSIAISPNAMRLGMRLLCEDLDTAELRGSFPFITTSAKTAQPLIGWTSRDAAAGIGGVIQQVTPDFVTLENVGEILKGDLILTSTIGTGVWAIETYLDVISPRAFDVTELPS